MCAVHGNGTALGGSAIVAAELRGVTAVSPSQFWSREDLKGHLELPLWITSLGDQAFRHCTGLTGVTVLAHSVTSIGAYAFAGCTSLSRLALPLPDETVVGVASTAFLRCPELTNAKERRGTAALGMFLPSTRDDAPKTAKSETQFMGSQRTLGHSHRHLDDSGRDSFGTQSAPASEYEQP
jgi:hypothetical protein